MTRKFHKVLAVLAGSYLAAFFALSGLAFAGVDLVQEAYFDFYPAYSLLFTLAGLVVVLEITRDI